MKLTVSKVLAWLTGGFFLIIALMQSLYGMLTISLTNILAALISMTTAAIVIPKSRQIIKDKYDLEFSRGLVIATVIIGLILVATLNVASSSNTNPNSTNATLVNGANNTSNPDINDQNIRDRAENISWEGLMRNESQHEGEIVYFKGQVVQVLETGEESYALRVHTKRGSYGRYYEDTVWINYQGSRVLEGDIVQIWGEFTGLRTYESTSGAPITIPEINAGKLEVVE